MIDQKTAPYGAFILRVTLGILFIIHGLFKIFVFTLPGAVAGFHAMGLPGWFAYAITFGELIGGFALVIGFYSRLFAILFFFEMLAVIYTAHWANGFAFTNKGGGWEYPAFWAITLVVLFLLGDGKWAVRESPDWCCKK